ncbi:GNAT family N-acetyltransferase [Actinoplanes bogorensis]|uniref:GNAT family N-acetyltransferase n=1 Tax=Paractinoplanes bogorensis TaxID=1610840 RepID=A0ABS5Z1B7_9ACTN|nr:GNAT family N-acetyltransferase [Actinoplanes bogorensis]MBU2669458.1 GNAT family N-acetyltransferase [Actinoplanes bogorensis]
MDESVRLRTAAADDRRAIADLLLYVFNEHTTDESRELEELIMESDRTIVAEDGDRIVGTAAAQTREMSLPGAVVPVAHVTGVGVAPTHRRRGILSAMMRRQLTEIAAAGREPVAALWASETAIYPRFGYGPACGRLVFDILSREVKITAPPAPPGRMRLVEPAAARAEMTALHNGLRIHRVGWSSRPEYWWDYLLRDTDSQRDGATESRGVIYETADGPVGYATWRVKNDWSSHGPAAEVRVREVVAGDPGVYAELWRFLLSLDLSKKASYHYGAVDEPLQFMVDEPRKLGARYADSLWIRLVDLPAALAARRYACPVDAVIEVTDPIIEANNGRWRLIGGPDKASCVRTDDAPDLVCSITELGAAYLGGTTLATLVTAGRARQLTDNLPSTAFRWNREPSSIEVF